MRRIARTLQRTTGDPLTQRHVGDDLGKRAARGALSTLGSQWSKFVLQTASTIVLARLLTPEDYGLVGMITALVGIGDALWNLGLQAATIQRREITHRQVTFFFWLQGSIGLLLTLATDALAFLIVGFYDKPQLYPIIFVYSTYFVISGFLSQHLAVLTRQMRFTSIAVIEILSIAVGLALAIGMAVAGAAYWAIVAQALGTLLVRLALYWYTSGWTPGRPRYERGMGPMLRFGLNLAVNNALRYAGSNADNVIIGKMYGTAPLGVYSRAYNLLLLPLRQVEMPVGRIAIPVLSYLQDQPERYRRYYRTAVTGLSLVAMPVVAALAALSHEVIAILLGPRWSAVAPIFQVLAIAGILQIVSSPNRWIFTSTGRTGRQAVWALISQPILIGSFVVGAPWGVVGISWAYTIATLVMLIPAFLWAVKDSPLRIGDVWAAAWRSLVLAGLVFGVGSAAHLWLPADSPWLVVLAGGGCAAAIVGGALLWWPSIRADVAELRRAVAGRRRAAHPAGSPQTIPSRASLPVQGSDGVEATKRMSGDLAAPERWSAGTHG